MVQRPQFTFRENGRQYTPEGWVFKWRVDEASNIPTTVNWASIDDPRFRAERQRKYLKLPGELQLTVRAEPQTERVIDVTLQLGVFWQGENRILSIPLLAKFDQNGNPTTDVDVTDEENMATQDKNEAIRDRILKMLFEGWQNSSTYTSSQVLADRLGMDSGDIEYHLRILQREDAVELSEAFATNDLGALLTPSGEQRVREGYRGVTGHTTTIGPIITASGGSVIQGVAANAGGIQSARIDFKGGDSEKLGKLFSQLRGEVEEAPIGEDDRREALLEVQSIELETQKRKPRLARIEESVRILAAISAGAALIAPQIVEIVKLIQGGG